MRSSKGPAGCVICTRSHLPQARVLIASYLEHHADGRLYLFVIDGAPDGELDARVTVVATQDLVCPHFYEMCVRYDPLSLSCALKSSIALTVLERYREERVFYLDGDLLLTRPLEEAQRLLDSADIVLTPHILDPIEPDGRQPDELYILTGGVYNMGFFGVRSSSAARGFLEWWASRVREGCRDAPKLGMYLDQRWIDLVPGLFGSVAILRDETYNVAYWNLTSRKIGLDGDSFLVNGRPLTLFHFSGIDLAARTFQPGYQDRFEIVPGSPLGELVKRYVALLEEQGWSKARPPYGFGSFDNGVPFHGLFRTLYLGLPEERRAAFGNPFVAGGAGSFFEWALTPDPAVAFLSPLLSALYESDPDIPLRFPDVGGGGRAAFIRWARTEAAARHGFDPGLIRADERLEPASQPPPAGPRTPR